VREHEQPEDGASTATDSFTPRRLRRRRMPMAAASTGSFHAASPGGRKLKMASPPPAIETEMVST